jgi:hypothetical protein
MKKARFIGALLAAVIAAAPATGLTNSVLSFNDNAIVADAADHTWRTGQTNASWKTSKKRVTQGQRFQWFVTTDTPIFLTSPYSIWLSKKGKLIFSKKGEANRVIFDYSKYIDERYLDSEGQVMTDFALYLQADGNIVVYNIRKNGNKHRIVDPVAISNTWMFGSSDVDFTYELTSDGVFQIKRNFIKGQFKGKSDVIWKVRYYDLPKDR